MDTMGAHPNATGNFVNLMQSIALAGKMISSRVNRAGLAGMMGATGEQNVHGEFVQKLDSTRTTPFCERSSTVGTPAWWSRRKKAVPSSSAALALGRYVVTLDPPTGRQTSTATPIGSIFGIYRRKSPEGTPADDGDVLRPGSDLVAAGYILYGSGTVLVLGTEAGVLASHSIRPSASSSCRIRRS